MREEYKSLYRGQQIDAATAAFLSGTLATREELTGKVDKVSGKGLSENDFTDADKNLLDSLGGGTVTSVNTRTGAVVLTSADVGLSNVSNTSDADKPVSVEQQAALNLKVNTEVGKGLSANDFTDALETKLTGIETGAQVNTVTSVASKTGAVTLVKADVGLDQADNTSDSAKPVSTATQNALDLKSNLSSAMGFINHGAIAETARPASYASVTWLGSVEPTNATNDDIWIDTSA